MLFPEMVIPWEIRTWGWGSIAATSSYVPPILASSLNQPDSPRLSYAVGSPGSGFNGRGFLPIRLTGHEFQFDSTFRFFFHARRANSGIENIQAQRHTVPHPNPESHTHTSGFHSRFLSPHECPSTQTVS